MRRIGADGGNADAPITRVIRLVGVKGDASAVVRPRWTPCLEASFRGLNGVAAGRRYHVQVIPTILIGEECDPSAIGRRYRIGSGFSPIRNTPKLLLGVFVDRAWRVAA